MKINQKARTPVASADSLSTFGAVLKAARINRRLTHAAVSAACGFSRQTLARIEKGDPSVSFGQIVTYAHHLGEHQFPFQLQHGGSAPLSFGSSG